MGTGSLRLLLALLILSLPVRPQLGAPLSRCGPHPPDPEWPRNQLPAQRVPSAPTARTAVDMARLEHDAKELADLSASLPAEIERVNHGLLPKDVTEKLRRTKKLSKRLRSDLMR